MALGLVLSFAACDVYDSQLIATAFGPGGSTGVGGSGGSGTAGAGRGGSVGSGGSVPATGGSAGKGGATGGTDGGGSTGDGGTVANGGTGAMEGGSDGDGGEDPGAGGSAGVGGTGGDGGGGAGGSGGDAAGSGGAGSGGKGGAGAGGTGGAGAGSGGAGAGAGGSGGAGTGGAGTGGTGGMGETCTGCARLSVPLATSDDRAHFTLLLPSVTDLSAATITFRIAKLAGTGGTFKGYIQEGSPDYSIQDGVSTPIADIDTSMQEIAWSIAGAGNAADKTMIRRIGIEIAGTGGSTFTNPTVLYLDSIVVTGSSLNPASFTFDTSGTVYTTPTGEGPPSQLYLNNYSADTNVTGAALSWLGP